MYKKLILCLAVLFVIGVAGNAFAANTYYMVDGDGSYSGRTTYTWSETPWLYVSLDQAVSEDHAHLDLTSPASTSYTG